MLSLYDPIVVPGVEQVVLHRDDELTHRFYLLTDKATLVRDSAGAPLFTFMLYARDVDRLAEDDREVERGYLALSTQVSVSAADQQKILAYLRAKLADELARQRPFLGRPLTTAEPELAYPPLWTEGGVELVTVPTAMSPFSAGSKEPSLVGTNVAVFAQQLDQEGAEFLRQSLLQGKAPALVNYRLHYAARIPSIRIRITGDRAAFYEEIKRHYSYVSWARTDTHYWFYDIRTLQEIRTTIDTTDSWDRTFQSLKMTVEDGDFRADAGSDVTTKLTELAFAVLKDTVLPSFFADKWAPSDAEKASGFSHNSTGTVDITFEQSSVIAQGINPSGILGQELTAADVAANTVWIDLSQLAFPELDVTVNANVDFAADPIYALKVFLSYDAEDETRDDPARPGSHPRVKAAKELTFRSADTPGRWRQIMAKSADGAPKDTYSYWSELVYKDTGKRIRVPATGMLDTQERQLIISYARLGFVKVDLLLGSLPPAVEFVDVAVRCPTATGSDATQTFTLTREQPTASYFTYTGKDAETTPYFYTVTHNLAGGQRMALPEQTSTAATLTVTNPFQFSVTTHFVAAGDFSQLAQIIVDAHYEDGPHDFRQDFHTELAKAGASADWLLQLRDPEQREFSYVASVLRTDGTRVDLPPATARLGGSVFVGTGGVAPLNVQVVNTVDWTKYQVAVVSLRHDDTTSRLHQSKEFVLHPGDTTDPEWLILLQDPAEDGFDYRVRLVGVDRKDSSDTGWVSTKDPVVFVG
ncbi:MAG TPA: hypothetical protein VLM05_07075 [Mycobacteriales bacterium]|nr:hypothetical protein [Mycobacteriales bacterium]